MCFDLVLLTMFFSILTVNILPPALQHEGRNWRAAFLFQDERIMSLGFPFFHNALPIAFGSLSFFPLEV